jgi:hypothetical protein
MAWIDNGRGGWAWDGAGPEPGPPPSGAPPSANTAQGADFFGEGVGPAQRVDTTRAPVATPTSPAFRPYARSGYGGRALTTGSREGQPAMGGVTGHQVTNVGGASGAYDAASLAGKGAFNAMHRGEDPANARVSVDMARDAVKALESWDVANQLTTQPAAPPGAGVDPGASVRAPTAPAAPAAPAPGGFNPQAADYSRYDAAAQDLKASRDVFQNELRRLSGVDPFGNQAFLQKATDRAVSQAAGTAAMARGGAAAQAGALRGQQGVQSQLAARGAQEMEQTIARDANTTAGLRLQAASGMAGVSGQLAENEAAFANKAADVGVANLNATVERYGIDANIGQRERESLRSLATEMQKVDMERYKTDMAYRMNVDDNIIAKYASDNALSGVLAQVEAAENLSKGEALMGLLGAGAGILGGIASSDRRGKTAIRPAKTAELKEYLSKTGGSHYRYREPGKAGRRPGDNYGPMAQDLQATKIGRTVVVEKADGLYVDTGRLALADHGALVALSQRLDRLARRVGRGAKK